MYNPLRNFTVQRAIFLLEQAERGIYADLQWVYRFMEKRDAVLRACIIRRRAALMKLDWHIKLDPKVKEDPEDEDYDAELLAKAKAQKKTLEDSYALIDNLKEAISWLALAEFRGFAHLEKWYSNDGDIIHLETVPQWYWARQMPRADWLYNPRAQSSASGVPINIDNFVIREVQYPVNEIGIISYLRKNLSQKDWDAFIETYGIPPLFVEMPQNAPINLSQDYQKVVEQVVSNGRGTLPFGAKMQSLDTAGGGGDSVFLEHIKFQNEQIVLAATGGKLTMLNDPTGLGSGQSDVHQETFDEIAQSEAEEISELFQRHVDRAILRQYHDGEQPLAFFELAAKDEEDVDKLVTNITALASAGYKMDVKQLSTKTGYDLEEVQPDTGAESESDVERAQMQNRMKRDSATEKLFAIALDREMDIVRNRLERIMRITDPVLRNRKLKELNDSLPQLLKDLNQDPATAGVLRQAMKSAFAGEVEKGYVVNV